MSLFGGRYSDGMTACFEVDLSDLMGRIEFVGLAGASVAGRFLVVSAEVCAARREACSAFLRSFAFPLACASCRFRLYIYPFQLIS
jgi:hypothetical protein